MTKQEEQTIRNIIARLQKRHCGCSIGWGPEATDPESVALRAVEACGEGPRQVEAVSRLYLDTWVIPSLEMLLPEKRNPDLALRMSR